MAGVEPFGAFKKDNQGLHRTGTWFVSERGRVTV